MKALLRRFDGRNRGTIFEKLVAVRQRGTIKERVQEFEMLVAQATEVTKEQVLGYFFTGLQGGLGNQIRPHNPRDLLTMMELATWRR